MAQVIAEFCQNHNGDIELLKEMVWAAKEAGADYAKIQTIFADDLTCREEFENGQVKNAVTVILKRPYEPERQRLKGLEISEKGHYEFLETCKKAGIEPLVTVFSRNRIPFVHSLGFRKIKVASIDCASYPMVEELAELFEFLIISTGATFTNEIRKTAQLLSGKKWAFLHCVSIYPTPLSRLNLNRLKLLRRLTPFVGFSDHSSPQRDGIKASLAAMTEGVDFIERHFTLLAPDKTKDGPVSTNQTQLKELCSWAKKPIPEVKVYARSLIQNYDEILGVEDPGLSAEELLVRNYYRGRFASHLDNRTIYNWENAWFEHA